MTSEPSSNQNALFQQALSLHQSGRLTEAATLYKKLLGIYPNHPKALTYLGNVELQLGNLQNGVRLLDQAIKISPNQPIAFFNRADGLQRLNRLNEALESYDRAIVLKPDYAEAHFNRGVILENLKRFNEALESYDRAIVLKPDYADAYWSKSNLKLLMGDYEQGWQLHEWRWKSKSLKKFSRNFNHSLWLGEQSIVGKTLLVHAEGGQGDVIQHCRYVPMAGTLGAKVVFEVPPSLVSLMSTLESKIMVVKKGKPLPDFDFHCPTTSLPLAFKTTLATIPARVPYLHADPDKKKIWHQRLGNKAKPRVGLVWSGLIGRKIDLNPAKKRSIPFQLLEPLLQLPFEFHSLQKDIRPDDAAVLSKCKQIHAHQDEMNDFSDTAALIEEMDLVISIDTSVAHLAGALGKTVWVLLPFTTDYRWTLDGTGTPWYPTATLYRQSAIGDWSNVILEITQRLQKMEFSIVNLPT